MNHDHVIERLPWLVNGSLDSDERRQMEQHLESCDACQAELQATREAFAIFDAHLPTEVLMRHAWGEDTGWPSELVEKHLASCPSCSEELALVQAGRRNLEAPSPFDPPRNVPRVPPSTGLRTWALAATVLMVVGLAGWGLTWQSTQQRADMLAQERAALEARVERLESAGGRAEGETVRQIAELQGEAERLREERDQALRDWQDELDRRRDVEPPAPSFAPAVFLELGAIVTRGTGPDPDLPEKAVPEGASLNLALQAPAAWNPEAGPFRAQVVGSGLEERPVLWEDGYFNLSIPAASLPTGVVTLEVQALGNGESQTYRFQRVE